MLVLRAILRSGIRLFFRVGFSCEEVASLVSYANVVSQSTRMISVGRERPLGIEGFHRDKCEERCHRQ